MQKAVTSTNWEGRHLQNNYCPTFLNSRINDRARRIGLENSNLNPDTMYLPLFPTSLLGIMLSHDQLMRVFSGPDYFCTPMYENLQLFSAVTTHS